MCDPVQSDRISLKKEYDAEKIKGFEADGRHKHAYDYEEWRVWTGNNYIKSYYDVKLPDGSIIHHCWANAGVLRKGFDAFMDSSNVLVRLSSSYPA